LKDKIRILEKNGPINDDFRQPRHQRQYSQGYQIPNNLYGREQSDTSKRSQHSQMRGTGMAESLNYDIQDNIGPKGWSQDPYMISNQRNQLHSRVNSAEELDTLMQLK
jgi:hypothetical protein